MSTQNQKYTPELILTDKIFFPINPSLKRRGGCGHPTFLELNKFIDFFFSQYIITDQNDGTSATVSEAGVVLTENSEGHRRGAQVCHSVYQLVVSFKSKINWQS